MEFSIAEGYEQVAPYLDQIRVAADSHREALGFTRGSVYGEFAQSNLLWALEKKTPNGIAYAGHLMFSCRYPSASILQMFVLPEHRRQAGAKFLLDHLKVSLIKQGFISIYARVAEDLTTANKFWERQQFRVQRVSQGGAARNRRILIRSHELPSPQLFPTSGVSSENPLDLIAPSIDIPLFLLDLNVLFDVMPRRLRHQEATSLFQAERMNGCRLAISDEIKRELGRTADDGRTDPMLAYIGTFPSFPLPEGEEALDLVRELATFGDTQAPRLRTTE